jgi:hypothetical protein
MQNDYDRAREMRDFDTIVLENNRIRAEFLAGFGTRLWSLYDKKLDRELLNVNPVFQLGNLALRNAWFAGGIEWNCGWPGHFPYTASPMHIVTVKDAPYPVLRCFEWERKRGIHWQIDFFLPDDDAAFLCSNVKICNPNPSEKPVYWWTNIAVDETDQSRVIVPADQAITNHSNVEDLPFINNEKESFDFTYPANSPSAKDYFFVLKAEFFASEPGKDSVPSRTLEVNSFAQKNELYYTRSIEISGSGWRTDIAFDKADMNIYDAKQGTGIFRSLK